MSSANVNPCRGCTDRRPGTKSRPSCHADCPRYAAFAAAREDIRAARDKERILDGYAGRSAALHRAVKAEGDKRRRERSRR